MSADVEGLILGAVLDAEGAVLASNAGALLDLAGLKASDFVNAHVRNAWGVVEKLVERRRPVDAGTVAAAGATVKVLPDGALEWLRRLQGANTLDRNAFAEVVEQVRRRRRGDELKKTLTEALTRLEAGDVEPSRVAGELEGRCHDLAVAGVGADETGDSDVLELGLEWEKRDVAGKPLLVPSGIRIIDEHIGGLPPNLSVWAGLPSVGKSALLATAIEQQLRLGFRVGLFGLEDGTRWLSKRIIARELKLPVRDVGVKRLDQLTAEQQARYPDVMQATAALLKGLVTYRRDTISAADLVRRSAHWAQNLGVQCIYVDHGGEVDHDTARFDDYRLAVADTYRHVRNFAVRYQVPVVVLAHTNRASERPDGEEQPPRASDMAETSYIERRARLILGLWRRQGEAGVMRVTVLKQTEGRAGQTLLLTRHIEAAMIDAAEGHEVNLWAERMAEQRKKREARDVEKQAKAEALAKLRESEKAAKKPKPPPQLAFGEAEA